MALKTQGVEEIPNLWFICSRTPSKEGHPKLRQPFFLLHHIADQSQFYENNQLQVFLLQHFLLYLSQFGACCREVFSLINISLLFFHSIFHFLFSSRVKSIHGINNFHYVSQILTIGTRGVQWMM